MGNEPPPRPGHILEMEMAKKGLSYRDIGRIVGVTYPYIHSMITGKRPIGPMYALLFAKLFDLPEDTFVKAHINYVVYLQKSDATMQWRMAKVLQYKKEESK